MKIYHKYQLVKFHARNGYDTYHAVKRVNYEDDRPVSIEEPENVDYPVELEMAKNELRLDAHDYGWEDELNMRKDIA